MAVATGSSTLTGADAGIVRVFDEADEHCGMGVLVRPSLVVTCAHVVNVALGLDPLSQERPSAPVRLNFPIVRDQPRRWASVLQWSAPGGSPVNDICLLRLDEAAPPSAGTAILADLRDTPLDEDPLSIFGFAPGHDIGRHVDARFVGRANAAWVQIDGVSEGQAFVEQGYSGAAVWDRLHECVVGLVVARQEARDVRIAYMLSARQVLDFDAQIPGERRRLPSRFTGWWTAYGALLFVALLFHFLGERSAQFPPFMTLGGGNKIMAGYYGLHLGAFFLPPFLWMTLHFARAFREHPWWMRVPAFGDFGAPPRPSRWRIATILSLLFLVLWPLWEQGHFLLRLHKQGEVYIYRSALTEEFEDITRKIPGTHCHEPSVHYCTHPEAGLYGLARRGIRDDQSYWDNMYHYGDRTVKPEASATFFPILQPLLMIVLTASCGGLAVATLWFVGRPARRTRDGSPTS